MIPPFSLTWDYRCPFARNAHEQVLAGLEAGAGWEVTFVAFSLDQAHRGNEDPPVWDEPDLHPGLLANQAGIVVRERDPERFWAVHRGLFAARHDLGGDLRDPDVVTRALASAGVDADRVLAEVDDGWPLETFRKEHSFAATQHSVFGVPTFIAGEQAGFVRLMDRPGEGQEAGERALAAVERIVALVVGWPELNELKHTTIPR